MSAKPDTQSTDVKSAESPDKSSENSVEGTTDALASALAKLNAALTGLDDAVDSSIESRTKIRSGDEEVQRMADDRARLARDLDGAEAKAERLAQTNSEVSRRLVGAMEMVRGVLDKSN